MCASGIAARKAASISCPSLAGQSDGALLLAGREGDHAFVSRLLASGAPDPNFAAAHTNMALHVLGPLAAGVSETELAIADNGDVNAFVAYEPVLLISLWALADAANS